MSLQKQLEPTYDSINTPITIPYYFLLSLFLSLAQNALDFIEPDTLLLC